MRRIFVDTNVFIRFFTNDDPKMADKAEKIFKKAIAGKLSLYTNELVIAEIVWTLQSFYKIPKEEIRDKIERILDTENLYTENSGAIRKALEYVTEENIDFIDGYILAYMEENKLREILTFDKKHFKKFKGKIRVLGI